jgi:hydroxyacylglutathione hydrolase
MPESSMQIHPIPAFSDNYLWCLYDAGAAWVVDPGDAAPVLDFLDTHGLRLEGILITHHHPDHIGGVGELIRRCSPGFIYGPDNSRIPGRTHRVGDGDRLELLGRTFEVLAVPGHTLDHLAYFSDDAQQPLLFCGDTLFAGGCGRLFEGTPAQMYASLQRLAALPPQTAVYCAHEYTQSNLRFAAAVEPANRQLAARQAEVAEARRRGQPTVPSRLADELATNPFLRVESDGVATAVDRREPTGNIIDRFAALRRWKDQF